MINKTKDYVHCGTVVARINTNAFHAPGIFRDVDVNILRKLC